MEPKSQKKYFNKSTGALGEQIAANYYRDLGFRVVGMNYWRKWGEIDVIAEKANKIYFIEVKTVSYETKNDLELAVTRRTYRPEENVHHFKLKKLSRVIDTWLKDKKWTGKWQIDVAAVRIVPRETFASVNLIQNVIFE